jgi:acyl-homoserine lactone acylase PvdQ
VGGTTSRAGLIALAIVALLPASAPAQQPYQHNDGLGFHSILPPGQNGLDTAFDVAAFQATGERPANNDDQLFMYQDLVRATPGLSAADLPRYFKEESFGVKPGDVVRTYKPRPDVTIQRDGFGVPHIYGDTIEGAMFGVGYASAEDRLFLMDVFRRVGRGESASFVGGSALEFDSDVFATAPYKPGELEQQFDRGLARYGAEGEATRKELLAYLAGVNQFIAEARTNPMKMPVEYQALGLPLGPDEFVPADIVASSIVLIGVLGVGGGGELENALALQAARKRFGRRRGTAVYNDFRSADDPEAPVTVTGRRFIHQKKPKRLAKGSMALPDPGSVKMLPAIEREGGAASRAAPGGFKTSPGLADLVRRIVERRGGMSNALLVSARESETGRPLAVFGPQTGYFGPQPLIEMGIHAPNFDSRGAVVIGTPWVSLGRGRDYAWSATSQGNDIQDVYALDLCEPDGSQPTIDSMHYRFRGQCLPIEVIEKQVSWESNLVDSTPSGSATFRALRTKIGLGIARATIKGKPVLYTRLRFSYGREIDETAVAVRSWQDPTLVRNADEYMRLAARIPAAFQWFYVDDKDIAYIAGGALPVRPKGVNHDFPIRYRPSLEWKGYNPDTLDYPQLPFSRRPQVVNQPYIVNWNNKQAHGYRSADGYWTYGSLYRSRLLEDRVRAGIKGANKMSLTELIDAMGDAATVDFRGSHVLPWMLKAIGKPSDPALADAVAKLKAWRARGAHREDADGDRVYEDAEAIALMDAWWPRWVPVHLERPLGKPLWNQFLQHIDYGIDNDPNFGGAHRGSAWQGSTYSYVQKDLRAVLGRKVKGRYSRYYCGTGKTRKQHLRSCRALLRSTLAEAAQAAKDTSKLYEDDLCSSQPAIGPEDSGRDSSSQWCYDAIFHQVAAALYQPAIDWQNRPTWQQAVEVQRDVPR